MGRWYLTPFLALVLTACPGDFSPTPPTFTLRLAPSPETGGTLVSRDGRLRCGAQGDSCEVQYPKGQEVVLQAQAEPFHYFSGWEGGCSGLGDCALTVQEDTEVVGRFSPFQGNFALEVPPLVVVPLGGKVEMEVALLREGGLDVPPWAYRVELESPLVGEAPDQVRVRYLPERSGPDRLVLALEGPDPAYLRRSYVQETAALRVVLPGLEREGEFTLAVARCGGGCP